MGVSRTTVQIPWSSRSKNEGSLASLLQLCLNGLLAMVAQGTFHTQSVSDITELIHADRPTSDSQ